MKSKSHIYMLLMGLFFSVSSCDYLAVSDRCQEACKIQIKYLKT